MPQSKTLRYTMFALLYFTQGTIFSYFTALNALYFLSKGRTMTDVGVFASIALIPFVIKIFFGMWSDKVNLFGLGHRKPFILLGLAVQFVCLLIAPLIDLKTGYWAFVALAFMLQSGMALYDTCTDGLALDTTPKEEEGTIQGFMVGGRAFGVVVTASAVGLLAQHVSWNWVFWLLAALTLLPLPLVLRIQEAEKPVGREFDWKAFGAFKHWPVIALALLGTLIFFIINGANELVNPFLTAKFKIDLSTAGFVTTIWGIGVVLGALGGGRFVSKVGFQRSVWLTLGLSAATILLLSAISQLGMAWPLVLLFGLAFGLNQTFYFAIAMDFTDPRIAASMFAILMAVTNIGNGIGMAVSGMLSDSAGFRLTFVVLAALNLLALPLLPAIFRKRAVR